MIVKLTRRMLFIRFCFFLKKLESEIETESFLGVKCFPFFQKVLHVTSCSKFVPRSRAKYDKFEKGYYLLLVHQQSYSRSVALVLHIQCTLVEEISELPLPRQDRWQRRSWRPGIGVLMESLLLHQVRTQHILLQAKYTCMYVMICILKLIQHLLLLLQ